MKLKPEIAQQLGQRSRHVTRALHVLAATRLTAPARFRLLQLEKELLEPGDPKQKEEP